jgi:hypothetical protein
MDHLEANLEQADRRRVHRELLNEILSSFDQFLEFDPKTGLGLKLWAW